MNSKWFIIIVLLLLGVGGFFLFKKLSTPKVVHYHAGFQVYVDGELKDFSSQGYMSLVPCGIVSTDPKTEQLEKAHLHEQIGDVVHVHRDSATWGDLFKNINFSIEQTKPFDAYNHGKKVENIMSKKIMPYDSVIIFIGSHRDIKNYLPHAVTKQHILDIEKHSESCGK